MVGVPALFVAAGLVTAGVALVRSDSPHAARLRTNPALPGTAVGRDAAGRADPSQPVELTRGPGWHLLYQARPAAGGCLQLRPVTDAALDPLDCGASLVELEDRGISVRLALAPASGWPTTLPPTVVCFGLVPALADQVILEADDGTRTEALVLAIPLAGAPRAFALAAPDVLGRLRALDAGGRVIADVLVP